MRRLVDVDELAIHPARVDGPKRYRHMAPRTQPLVVLDWAGDGNAGCHHDAIGIQMVPARLNPPCKPFPAHVRDPRALENAPAARDDRRGKPDQVLGRVELGLVREPQRARCRERQRGGLHDGGIEAELARRLRFGFDRGHPLRLVRIGMRIFTLEVARDAKIARERDSQLDARVIRLAVEPGALRVRAFRSSARKSVHAAT